MAFLHYRRPFRNLNRSTSGYSADHTYRKCEARNSSGRLKPTANSLNKAVAAVLTKERERERQRERD
ncbi:hypothetical protein PHYPO_G00152950 [Pangasianodon hypophthalmus]|uniref:Uncharacterized protein n=1 Tax=Pangasianodon hypophthalmus TaxID=310915 RepID=A0A5N5K141_PANHP|nr:hypothetical protein PHYPO_G00152950 [Pangasianodon hypophthalmus]